MVKKRGRDWFGLFKKTVKIGFWVLLAIIFVNLLFSLFSFNITLPNSVAIIPVKGTIMSEGGDSFFERIVSADTIIEQIRSAEENPNIKAILFEINSPGGSAVASDQIAQKIKKIEKPTMALIKEVGASGGYWIASSCDSIMANRMSITGSIGVIASYLEFSGLLNDYNISYQRLVAGEYKDLGSPYKQLTDEEKALFQKQLDRIHEYFIAEIAENRGLSIEEVRELSTGMFYLGSEALELGLIDSLGNRDDAIQLLKENLALDSIHIKEFEKKRSFWQMISTAFSKQFYLIGKGIGSVFSENTQIKIII